MVILQIVYIKSWKFAIAIFNLGDNIMAQNKTKRFW